MSSLKSQSDRLQYPVSIVQGNKPKILQITTIKDLLNKMVLDEDLKEHTRKIRSSTGKKQSTLKEKTLAFLLGKFDDKRNDDNIKEYIQVMAFDIDKISHTHEFHSIFEALQECEHTFLAFPSVRGKGIRFLVCHDAPQGNHKEAYNQIAESYSKFLNIALSSESTEHAHIDLQCSNISRHWFIGHAEVEEIHHNDDSVLFHFIKQEKTKAPTGEEGSSPDNIKVEDKIEIIKIITNDQNPFVPGSRQRHVFKMCKLMCENGISQSDALDQVSTLAQEGFDFDEIRGTVVRTYKRISSKIEDVYSDAQLMAFIKILDFKNKSNKEAIDKILSKHPEIEKEAENQKPTKFELALSFIEANFNLERNEITRFVEDAGDRMTENDYNSIYIDLKYNRHKINKNDTFALINSNRIPTFNPFIRFAENNSHYSSNGHILKLAQSIHTTTGISTHKNFTALFVSKWYVGMIAAAFGNYVNPLLLVFCGGQNTGKTEWFRRLLPDDLKEYMAESKLDEGKDSEILMTDKLLILDDEYGGKSKRDSKRLKELISKDYFTVRPAYARTSERLRRISSLCGTSNEFDVLSDITGNRRVVPLQIIDIHKELYNSIDKTALFMEGYRTFLAWEKKRLWQLSSEEIEMLNSATSDFEEVRVEKEMILKYFEIPDKENASSVEFYQTSEIAEFIQSRNNMRLSVRRIGAELRAMNLQRVDGKGKNRKMKGYLLAKKSNLPTDKPVF